jgi:hypothetical protein
MVRRQRVEALDLCERISWEAQEATFKTVWDDARTLLRDTTPHCRDHGVRSVHVSVVVEIDDRLLLAEPV